MKFEQAFDKLFDAVKANNPNFQGFTEEYARGMSAAWNMMAILQNGENSLDDMAIIGKGNNIISLPLPLSSKTEKVIEKEQKKSAAKSKKDVADDSDSPAE